MEGSTYATTPRGSLSTLRATNYNQSDYSNKSSPKDSPNMGSYQSMDKTTHTETVVTEHPVHKEEKHTSTYGMSGSVGTLIVWFFIIFIATWLVLYALKPSIVLKRGTREVDTGKILLAAAIISLIVIILIWLIKGCTTKRW